MIKKEASRTRTVYTLAIITLNDNYMLGEQIGEEKGKLQVNEF